MTDSQKLLAEYVETGSEPAFREIVTRYLNLVYSVAVRMMKGDTHRAEDVAQTVFADLARMARTLSSEVMLGGWLHRHTYHVAATILRSERRRQSRERQVAEMNALQDYSGVNFAHVAPVLDEVINELGTEDRMAILLRFFEQSDFRAIGHALGTNEDAAQKRVTRALEKLHSLLNQRGVAFSTAALGTALATEAVTAAPAGLAVSISFAALANGAVTGGTTLTLLKVITMTKLKFGIISAIAVTGVATPLLIQYQAQVKLRERDEALRQQADQLAQLTSENQRLSNFLVQAKTARPAPSDQSELLRLRAEVSGLRRNLQQKAAEASDPASISAKALAARAIQLKQRLEQMPDKRIPEFQFLAEKDWLDAVKNGDLDTDADYRKAFSELRSIAKRDFGNILRPALERYTQSHDGQLPNDLSELSPLMQPPVADSILQRYSLLLTGNPPDLTRETLLVMETAPPADEEYDTFYLFRLAGQRVTTLNPNIKDLLDAAKEYARANSGQFPSETAQLAPHLKEPVDEAMLRAFLNAFPPNATLRLK